MSGAGRGIREKLMCGLRAAGREMRDAGSGLRGVVRERFVSGARGAGCGLRGIWLDGEKKGQFMRDLESKNININLIKSLDNLEDSDSFDVIAHIGKLLSNDSNF